MVAVPQPLALAAFAALVASLTIATPDSPSHPRPRLDGMPVVAPADVGMSAERLELIDRVVGNAIDAGGFPGAAVIVGRHGAIAWQRGYGTLGGGSTEPVDPERTMYDLASLTKVVATTTAVMVLADHGRQRLDDRVSRWIPEFRGEWKSAVTIRHLLAHRSGLPAGRDLAHATPAQARRRVLNTPLRSPPGLRFEYSDVGLIVLGVVVERVTEEPLDRYVRRAVHSRLGMRSTTFRPSRSMLARVAASERGVPRGQVHDRTAHALGDIAGHAGLFSTAHDLAVFAQFMLDHGRQGTRRFVSDTTVTSFTRRGLEGRQALGWETCAGGGSCGRFMGPSAFGHTGFTGTSIWMDPERDMFVIVLTNWIAGNADGVVAPSAVLHDVRGDVADLAALAIVDGPPTPMPGRLRSDAQLGWIAGAR